MMKKYFNFALLSAIVFAGTFSFTACSSSEDAAETDNPTYDPVKQTVTAQFVLNIASDTRNNNPTRSAGTTVQAGGENFRGIDNTMLFAYKTGGTNFVDATAASANAASRFVLGTLAPANSLNDGNDSHRILELSVPTGTDAMLFYGKAMKITTPYDINEEGKVTYTIPELKATAFNFALNQRVATENKNRYEHTAELLAAVMTEIINAKSSYTVEKEGEGRIYPDWTGAAKLEATWQELNPETQKRSLSPLEEILYKAFTTLTSIGENELRGGSSKAIITTVKDLQDVVLKVAEATPTDPYEELGQRVASNINTRINKFFNFTSGITGLKALGNTKEEFGTAWKADWNDIDNNEYQDFPVTNFNLPEGAAMLLYNATENKFLHKHPSTSILDRTATADPLAYMYPAELLYYANSGVRTSNKEKTSSGFPNGVANWDNDENWKDDWTGTTVTSATRATAMTKNVNYGVAMLRTTVGIGEKITQLEDNRAALNKGETNKTFVPGDIDFTLTGVIVGGQPDAVDWQFLPTGNTFNKFVYDNRVTGKVAGIGVPKDAGGVSAPNYTILFDNYNSQGAQQNKVRVGLQFVNNGDSFWGRDNLIRKGQTFYLVGELDPKDRAIASWDKYYQVPPLDAAGNSTKTTRIFVQDYMTTAYFYITSESLQNAFVTLPDLRSTQLSFGLSVDLDWRPGLDFSVQLGGN